MSQSGVPRASSGWPRSGTEAAIGLAVRESRSEMELARALGVILRRSELPEEHERQAFLEAVSRVQSPGPRGRLLVGVLNRAHITAETGRSLLAVARNTQDDAAVSRVLGTSHRIQETDVMYGPLMPDLLRTVETLRSPAAKGHALRELLAEAPISVDTGCEVLRLTSRLGDDREMVSILELMHRIRERDLVMDPLALDYVEAAKALSSSAERTRALTALLRRGPLPREAVVRALQVGRGLALEEERLALAQAIAPLNARSADVRRAVEALSQPLPDAPAEQVAASAPPAVDASKEAEQEKDGAEEVVAQTERREGAEQPDPERGRAEWVVIEPNDPAASDGMAHVNGNAQAESESLQHAGARGSGEESAPVADGARRRDERSLDDVSSQVGQHARALIRDEERAFEAAKRALRASARALREKTDRVARELREEVEALRKRVRKELQESGISDEDKDPTSDTRYGMEED
ncbi:MAG: hypothetical protein L0Y64_05020 [Myxococcaceae bacterium]|nr:hypothetical protein [Myxococcaceae bacterium]